MNKIIVKQIPGMSRNSIPSKDENFFTDYDVDKFSVEQIEALTIYKRCPEDCPNGIGNWMFDFHFKEKGMFYIKFPIEMKDEDVMRYAQPLIDKLNELHNTALHEKDKK